MTDASRAGRPACRRRACAATAAVLVATALSACSDPGPTSSSASAPTAPGPVLFIGDQFAGSRRATRAVVDAGTVWLLDASGDFVFGAEPSANWTASTGLALAWAQIPGAAKYHVMARNTVTTPTSWKELLAVAAPDPRLNPTVVASGLNPWTAGLGTGGYPWSFGNHVELAITADDDKGNAIAGALTESLETADEFPGVVTSVAVDDPSLPPPFAPTVERGATFSKAIRLSFSEPMRTAAIPTLTPLSDNLALRRVRSVAWGADPGAPSFTPASAAAHAFLEVELTARGACSELLVARAPGDVLLDLRDVTLFGAGPDARLLLLDSDTGDFLAEAMGVTTVATSLGRIALGAPLARDVPAGALACALSGGAMAVPRWVNGAGERIEVSDASPFFVGEEVAVYEPQVAGTAQVEDVRTIVGVDTGANAIVLSAAPSPGHGTSSFVLPLNGLGGEVALRPSAALALLHDALGGAGVELSLAGPASVMVGDTVLVDGDGDLRTTFDQAQARVREVRFAPPGAPAYSIIVDLPGSLLLLHGRAIVIGLGDAFQVGGTLDTGAASPAPLDPHADQFTPDGLLF